MSIDTLQTVEAAHLCECQGSHGGSCCSCGSPFMDNRHLHVTVQRRTQFTLNGGNVCSGKCLDTFIQRGMCSGHKRNPIARWRYLRNARKWEPKR